MNVALYARVSTEEQADEGHSLPAQLRAMRDFAQRKGWQIVGEYVDPGVSGRSMSRPAMSRLLADAQQRQFDCIITHSLDRFSRSLVDTLTTLAELQASGITYVSVNEQMDFTTPIGKVLLALLAAFAQYFIDILSRETKKGKQERARKGLYNGVVPFGYERVARLEGQQPQPPHISPRNVDGLRMAFDMCAQGFTPLEISHALNEAGYRTTGNRGANPFGVDTVLPMLKNRFPLGEVRYKGEWLPGAHLPAVDPLTWDT